MTAHGFRGKGAHTPDDETSGSPKNVSGKVGHNVGHGAPVRSETQCSPIGGEGWGSLWVGGSSGDLSAEISVGADMMDRAWSLE